MNINRSPYDQNSEALKIDFITRQLINKNVNTCDWVEVVGVDDNNKTVDVSPLVTQLSADKQTLDHSIIYGVTYINAQASKAAVIITPVIGDMGLCVYAQNDVTGVKSSKKIAPPTSLRTFDYADGCFIGCISSIAPIPTTFIEVKDDEILLTIGSSTIKMTSDEITINASSLKINANTEFTGTLTSNGTDISNAHTHMGVQSGASNTGVVTP